MNSSATYWGKAQLYHEGGIETLRTLTMKERIIGEPWCNE